MKLLRLRSGGRGMLLVGLITTVIFMLLSQIWVGAAGYAPIPIWDMWDQATPEQLSGQLFARHNDHRIAVSRLIFWLDLIVARGSGAINLFFVYAFNAAHWMLLTALAIWTWPKASPLRIACAMAVSSFFAFSGFQYENLLSGFQNQFTGVFFFASLSIVALCFSVRLAGVKRTEADIVCVVSAILCTLCMANGLLIFLLLPTLAFLLGRRAFAIGLILAGALAWYFYLQGEGGSPTGGNHPFPSSVRIFSGLLAYLGGPLPNSLSMLIGPDASKLALALARAAGFLAFLAVAFFLSALALRWWGVKGPDRAAALRPEHLAWAGIALFVVGSGAVTALGRGALDQEAMLASRYGAGAGILWAGLSLWAVFGARGPWRLAAGSGSLLVGGILSLSQIYWLSTASTYAERKRDSQAVLLAGVSAPQVLSQLYPDPNRVIDVSRQLAAHRLGMFQPDWARVMDKKLSATTSKTCGANTVRANTLLDSTDPAYQLRVEGLAVRNSPAIAVIGGDGMVHGLLLKRREVPRHFSGFLQVQDSYWQGYAKPSDNASSHFLALDGSGQPLCRLAGELDLSRRKAPLLASPAVVGPPGAISTVATQSGVFPIDGQYPDIGAPRGGGLAWGSWAGADTNIGKVELAFAPQGLQAFALPIVTGPDPKGQSFVVRADGVVLLEFIAPAAISTWKYVRVSVPERTREIQISVADASSEWGGWAGVGEPRSILATPNERATGLTDCPKSLSGAKVSSEYPAGWVDQVVRGPGTLVFSGWAIDPITNAPAVQIVTARNDEVLACAELGIERIDVALAKNNPELSRSGFKIELSVENAASITFFAQQADGTLSPLGRNDIGR